MVDQNIVQDAETKDVEFGTTQLSDAKHIDSALAEKLKSSHAACYKKTSDGGLPVHEQVNKPMLGKNHARQSTLPLLRSCMIRRYLSINQLQCRHYKREREFLQIVCLE